MDTFKCDSYYEYPKFEGHCYATKECELCTCGGDYAKCNFYPQIRAKSRERKMKDRPGPGTTTIYYAHHQWKYGTKIEEYELELIKRYFPNAKIFNPAIDLISTKKDGEDVVMEECLNAVEDSDILVFSSLDGTVGTGVYQEVTHATKQGKIIFYIYKDSLTMDYRLMERTDSRKNDRIFAFVHSEFY